MRLMKVYQFIALTSLIFLLLACNTSIPAPPSISSTRPATNAPTQTTEAISVLGTSSWNMYDSDPDHIWNRVFRQFYRRTATDGKEYGLDELDPLLWFDTTYLLNGVSHQQAIQVLDEFLTTHAENLIENPLKRAMFQRDLLAIFDWLAFQSDSYSSQRQALETRLAQIIKRVALTKGQIMSLPDNYILTVQSNVFPANYQVDDPKAAFLPSDLFQLDSAWVPIGRAGGPIAMAHTESFPFFGRSVFLVFVRSPYGRAATFDFIHTLNTDPSHAFTLGLDIALVRRMLLIDNQGSLVLSPLIETIQIRHFNPEQIFHEFELDRMRLLNGDANILNLKTDLFMLFSSHGDVFEISDITVQATIPEICKACHFENPPLPNPANIQSILSYSRTNFPLPNNARPILVATTWTDEAEIVINWKTNHITWKSLRALWNP